ncbi:serine hydrolase [Kaistia terrae]|uniref:Serine hydrolase n=1 Tax=Kaistia terrae TaxID=537017 RepID=A0ABW0Q2K9_9HYPH|nr:serine hydrolase [Kaistia terrae]MCX5581547.1 serine hydrolase [Kaistia terrae]
MSGNGVWRFATAAAFVGLGWGTASAEPVSRDKVLAALPRLEAMAQQLVADRAVPGLAIAIVHEDQIVYLKGFGLRDTSKAEVVDPDTVFQIASLSKPIASTVVASLVSDGVVGWDTRIADLDPAFRLHDAYPTAELTIRDLLAHRSGLPGLAGNELEDIGFDRETVLHRLRLVPPSSSFRAGYSYSNAGFTEAGVAAARPTGKPWEEVSEERLYRPLGMNATSSRHADFLARANRAALHIDLGQGWEAKVTRDPDMQSPAAGVSSSARDLAQWVRLQLAKGSFDDERLIGAEALAATHVPLMALGTNPATGATSFYGLGWNVELGRHGLNWGHAGAFSLGSRTLASLYPDASLGIVVLTNAFPTGAPEGLADSFFDLVFDGTVSRDWGSIWGDIYGGLFGPAVAQAKAAYATPPTPPSPPLPLAAYAGHYRNAYVGEAQVAEAGGALTLALGPKGARTYPLSHFDRDLFLIFPDAEMPDRPSAIRFAINPAGKAETVTIEFLDDEHLGTLARVAD